MTLCKDLFADRTEFLECILDSIDTGIFVCGTASDNYAVYFINQAYARYIGHSREEILGRPITDFIPDSRAPYVTGTGRAERGDTRTFKDESGERVIVVNRLPLWHNGEVVGMLTYTLFGSREEYDTVTRRVEYLSQKLNAYARRMKTALAPAYSLQSIVGRSSAMREFREVLQRYARTEMPLLITGATGTGKELAAGAVHCESLRAEGAFVSINCAAVPKDLFEAELFGYAPGAFSGAHRDGKVGQIELADKGTLFLDEVGDTPLLAQAKLLRVLEERVLYRVGSPQPRAVDFRLVAATNRNLKAMIAEGSFREDLYYRISSLLLEVPPVHQRRDDIPLLVAHFLQRLGRENIRVTDEAMEILVSHCWPGNVRELRNVIARALSLCRNNTIDMGDLPPDLLGDLGTCPAEESSRQHHAGRQDLHAVLASNELRLVVLTLQKEGWNVSRAARALGIARATMYEKMKKYGLVRNRGTFESGRAGEDLLSPRP